MKLNIRALSNAVVRRMTTIAKNPEVLKKGTIGEHVDLHVDKLLNDYQKEVGESKEEPVKIIKENE